LPEDQAAALERARIATAPLADARAILDRQVNAQWEARRAAAREKPVNPATGEE
jgi:hypothetical protein